MKKTIITSLSMILVMGLLTGCGNNKKEKTNNDPQNPTNTTPTEETVVENQNYEGLEFLNIGASNGVIKTVVINNTGYVYEGSKVSMRIMDASGNVIKEMTVDVTTKLENGTTATIETKVDVDLSTAASIEYSIVQ